MSKTHKVVGERFREAGLHADRFVSVRDGEKMCIDHDTRYELPVEVPGRNYGVYADADGPLVVLDIDDHDGGEDVGVSGLAALGALPPTFETRSPHGGTHRYYRVETDNSPIADRLKEKLGRANPVPSWGEVQAKNKYVVGPGSQLDGCDKDWCDNCGTSDGGLYEVNADRQVETIGEDELIEALAEDPDLSRRDKTENKSLRDVSETDNDDKNAAGGVGEDQQGDREVDQSLERWQVEALLETLPGDQHFDDWIRTGYAVYSWDSTEVGKEVFESWSEENEKWERSESQRQIDYIWSEGEEGTADDKTNATVGTLIHDAREAADDESVIDDIIRASASRDSKEPDTVTWADVRDEYRQAEAQGNVSKGHGRELAQKLLEREHDWMFVVESERLWVYDDHAGTFHRWGEQKIAEIMSDNLGPHYTTNERRQLTDRISAQNQVHREEINAKTYDDPLLCVGNGVVNLATGELYDHSPEYRFTRALSWDYPTEENDVEADQQPVVDFLDSVTRRPEDRDTLLDHLAHGLMPGHPYRAFVVVYGPGGNGKTQVANLFQNFVGEENAANVEIEEFVNDDFATGDLPGKFINWGDDMSGDKGGTIDELSLLKKASGGSYIRANEKFEKTFNFKNEAALFFSTNNPPRIGESKMSMKDRLYPIRMPYQFTADPDPDDPMQKKKIPKMAETLSGDPEAMRGLLELAVEHAAALRERRGEYSMPEGPEERWSKYNEQADPIVRFGRIAFDEAGPDSLVRKDDAYDIYTEFVEAWDEQESSKRGFKRQFPRAVDTPLETKQSRALATDKDADLVRCWNRISWTEEARSHMPVWMQERYAEHFDAEPGDEEAASEQEHPDGSEPLTNLGPAYGAEITAEVAALSDGEYNREQQGRLRGPKDTYIGFVVPGGNEPLDESFEGETVKLESVTLRTDEDGLLEAVIDDATTVESVAKDGETAEVDQRPEQAGLAETDGGENNIRNEELDKQIEMVTLANRDGDGAERETVATTVANKLGIGVDRVDARIDQLLEAGNVVFETTPGTLNTLR